MKNLTLRNLFPLAIIMVGLLLWIPQGWAATIHSVAAGGDWNKAETWVGGQVPTKDDSVVVNGVVNVSSSISSISNLTVSSGSKLFNYASHAPTLTINGNVINNGSILDNTVHSLTLKIAGDLSNNSILKNNRIIFIDDSIVGKVTATSPIESSEIHLDANIEIVGNVTFSEKFHFSSKQLTINQPNIATFGDIDGTGTINGMGTLWLTGSVSSNLSGKIKEIIFKGANQNISGTFTANTIVFGGTGTKAIKSSVINGSIVVNKGVTIFNYASHAPTLTINGNVINNGDILDNDTHYLTLTISGNILNNGTWNNSRTTLSFPSGQFRMTNTPTWNEPKHTSSYEITDYLTTQHHWQVSADGNTWSEQRGINDPSLVATVGEVTIPEPPKPDTPKICEVSEPSNVPATFNDATGELYLPQVRINTQYGNLYSINLVLQSQSAINFKFKLTDFCQFENPLTIADGENTAILNDNRGIIYIPSIDYNGVKFHANLYLVKTEGWIIKKEIDDLVGEEAILDYNKEITFTVPISEVIGFGQDGPLVPLVETLSSSNKIELSSGILMMNAILGKFENSLDPEGIYWKLDKIEFAPKWGSELTPEVFVHENLDLSIWKHIGRDNYEFTLQRYL